MADGKSKNLDLFGELLGATPIPGAASETAASSKARGSADTVGAPKTSGRAETQRRFDTQGPQGRPAHDANAGSGTMPPARSSRDGAPRDGAGPSQVPSTRSQPAATLRSGSELMGPRSSAEESFLREALPFLLDEEPASGRATLLSNDAFEARPATESDSPEALSVGALGRMLKRSLEERFRQPMWVHGEIRNLKAVPRGHVYFSLKDEEEDAILDAVIYKTSLTTRMREHMREGAKVRVRGRPTFWAPRCRTQFAVDRVEPTGDGARLLALQKLKERLTAEGLFDGERKRALPPSPRIIGVVTSASGAVIHDIRKVAFRRGGAHLLLAPAAVQGAGAAESMIRALAQLTHVPEVDVIILARGGGSGDDLMAFNDEALVRAVAACPVPVVSAVGHEVDVSLTDFAADKRAATPSQAAELVVADQSALRREFALLEQKVTRAMRARITRERLALAEQSLVDPRIWLGNYEAALEDLARRLESATTRRLQGEARRTEQLHRRLLLQHPGRLVAAQKARLLEEHERLRARLTRMMAERRARLGRESAKLDALSPLRVLARGYAIGLAPDGRAVRSVDDVTVGDTLRVLVSDGEFETAVRTKTERRS